MSVWTILDYLDGDGSSPIEAWMASLPEDAQAAITVRLLNMESVRTWRPKWVTQLVGWNGLLELRIPFNKVQYRPLAMYRPGLTLVLLCGAIEKGDEIPKRHLETADRRRKQLEKDSTRVKPHEF